MHVSSQHLNFSLQFMSKLVCCLPMGLHHQAQASRRGTSTLSRKRCACQRSFAPCAKLLSMAFRTQQLGT